MTGDQINEAASRFASRTEFGEVIFPDAHWEDFVALLATPKIGHGDITSGYSLVSQPQNLLRQALAALESCGAAAVEDGGAQWFDEKLVDDVYQAIANEIESMKEKK